jgi:hypothetical protein
MRATGTPCCFAGEGQRVAEVLAVRGVDERVRGQDRFQRRERLARRGEDDRAHDVVAVRAEIGEGRAQARGRALLRLARETVEQGPGLGRRQLLRRVVRLLRFGIVRHLDAASIENLR